MCRFKKLQIFIRLGATFLICSDKPNRTKGKEIARNNFSLGRESTRDSDSHSGMFFKEMCTLIMTFQLGDGSFPFPLLVSTLGILGQLFQLAGVF